jgi:hypothetical protein
MGPCNNFTVSHSWIASLLGGMLRSALLQTSLLPEGPAVCMPRSRAFGSISRAVLTLSLLVLDHACLALSSASQPWPRLAVSSTQEDNRSKSKFGIRILVYDDAQAESRS